MRREAAIFVASVVGRLSKRQPPWMKKDDVADEMALETGVWYRTPWYADDHMLWPGTDHALCGRVLSAPLHELIYEELAASETVVQGLVFVSSRKGNKCSECTSTWKRDKDKLLAQAAFEEEERVYSAEADAAYATLLEKNPARRMADYRLMGLARLVQRELGGEFV